MVLVTENVKHLSHVSGIVIENWIKNAFATGKNLSSPLKML